MSSTVNFIENYFSEEKIESLFFIILGIIAITSAFIFLGIIKYSFFKGMAIPLLLIGIIQLTVGVTVYNRSPKDNMRVQQIIKNEPNKIKTEELPRMEKVMKNFTVYKWLEIILFALGFIIFIVFCKSPQSFWKGLGLALMIQAGVMFSLDLLAEQRGRDYLINLTKETVL